MGTKLLVFGVAVTLVNIATESSSQTYEVYEAYPQPNGQYQLYKTHDSQQLNYGRPQQTHTTYNQNPYQYYQTGQQPQYQYQTVQRPQQQYQTAQRPQQHYQTAQQPQYQYQTVQQPQQQYKQQQTYTQKSNAQVSVSEAEWVCTNPKTNDMMIIAVDDGPGSRNNGPPQWHQVQRPQNNQPNNVQPQPTFGDPTYFQQNPNQATTEKAPVRPNNNFQPTKPPANPTKTFTTTERGPIWPSNEGTTTRKTVSTSTPQPPVQGFTVEDTPTTGRPFYNNPFFDPTTQKPKTTTSAFVANDDDEPIEIVMGK